MALESPSILIVPGLGGSGPEHWQTSWQARLPDCVRVEQEDWNKPDRDAWTARLDAAVRTASRRVVIVAHSLGCATVAHWAARADHPGVYAAAAMLVAPADVERIGACAELAGFAPLPNLPLPFRSLVVASSNDPYASLDRARCFADRWGSAFVDAGPLGHINAAANLGDWQFGQIILEGLIERAGGAAERYRRAAMIRSVGTLPVAAPCRPQF